MVNDLGYPRKNPTNKQAIKLLDTVNFLFKIPFKSYNKLKGCMIWAILHKTPHKKNKQKSF